MSAALRILRVELAGFGLYSSPTRFVFPPHAGVLCGPNESGKSTLLNGISAILFGLPGGTDPTKFGAGRFRSFHRTPAFWGEIEWEREGRRFRLHRAFESHRVRLQEITGSGMRDLYVGEHNPLANSSAGSSFPAELRSLLGLSSLELFQSTFCLTQPTPGDAAIGSELQHLLSGSRSGRVDDVLDRLFQEVRNLTKMTRELEVLRPGTTRPTNQKDPGRIEKIREELESSRKALADGRGVLEELNRSNQDIETAEKRILERENLLRASRTRLKCIDEWLAENETRRRRGDAIQQVRAAMTELADLDRQRRELEPLLATTYAGYENAPAELPALIEEIEKAAREHRSARQRAEDTGRTRTELEEETSASEARLASEFADVRGRPELVEVRDQLAAALTLREERRGSLAKLVRDIERMETALAELKDWDGIRPEALRLEAEAIVSALARIEAIEKRLGEITGQREAQRFLSSNGATGGLRIEALRAKIEAEEMLRELSLRLRGLEVEPTPVEAARRPGAIRRLIPAAAGIVVAALLLAMRQSALLSAGVGVAVAAIVFAILLGVRFAAARKAKPQTSPGQGPVSSDLEAARAEQKRLEEKIARLSADLGPFALTSAKELAAMEERWRNLEAEAGRIELERDDLLKQRFGTVSPGWRELPVSALAPGFSSLARIPGSAGAVKRTTETERTAGDLMAWLETLTPQKWDALQTKVDERERLAMDLATAKREHSRLEEEEVADRAVERLSERLSPFTAETPREEIQRRLTECAALEMRQGSLQEQMRSIPVVEELQAEIVQTQEATTRAWQELVRLWPGARRAEDEPLPQWIARTRTEEREARSVWDRSRQCEASERSILGTARAPGREDLAARETEENAALGLCLKNIETLEAQEPLLAASREIGSAMERELRIREAAESLRVETGNSEAEIETDKRRRDDLHTRLASLKGSHAPNLARLEIRIRRLEEEEQALLRERDAVSLAYRWVKEAAQVYQSTYREDLEARITTRFVELTGVAGRTIRCSPEFKLAITGPAGERIAVEQLSQGARDQLSFALRLAAADLLAGSVPLPLFLDDPFVHYDAARLSQLRETLNRLSGERQWVMLTHKEELKPWGEPVRVEEIAAR